MLAAAAAARGGGTPRAQLDFDSPRGGGTPRAQLDFDFLLVIDFEATCMKGEKFFPQEIIEFPSVLVDCATGRLAYEFRRYVRPRYHPVLTDFCRDLTGIGQSDVDGGVDLAEALQLHDMWLAGEMAAARAGKKGSRFAVVTWGDWDCRSMLEKECEFKGIAKPHYFDRWIDLRVPFQSVFGGAGERTSLQEAVRAVGLELDGRLHCGLDDARNTARILVELMRRGVQLRITGSLAAAPQEQPPQPQLSPCIGPPAYFCYCGVPARGGVMMVPGSMQGQPFYGCGSLMPAMGAPCPYFMWAM